MRTLHYETLLILNRLRCAHALMQCAEDLEPKDKDGEHNANQSNATKTEPSDRARYVDQCLREIERFERGYERKAR